MYKAKKAIKKLRRMALMAQKKNYSFNLVPYLDEEI